MVHTAVDDAFRTECALTLAWYDALLELGRAPEGRLEPKALEGATLLPQYALSRLLDRLERAGFVRRLPHADDGRRQLVEITREGRAAREKAWPAYRTALLETIGARLTPEEQDALAALLAKLAA